MYRNFVNLIFNFNKKNYNISKQMTNSRFITLLKIAVFFLIIYLFFKFINQENFLSILSEIKLKNILLIYIFFLTIPILITVRWFIIIRNFSKIKFIDFFRNIINGFSFSLILSSALAIDAAKFIKIKKKLGNKKSIILVFLDKFLALSFKLIFVVFVFIIYLYFSNNPNINLKVILIIFLFFITIIFFNLIYIINFFSKSIFSKENLKIFNNLSSILNKNIYKLFFINLFIQLLNIFIYFLIFLSLNYDSDLLQLSIFVPFVELLGQLQLFIFGIKELSTVFIFGYIDISKELALVAALVHTFVYYLTVITLYVFLNAKKKFNLK